MRAAVLSLFVLASYAPLAAETRKLPEVTYPVLDRILRDEKQTISERVDRVIDALPDHVARYNGDTRLIMPWFGKFKSLLPPNDYIRIVQRLTDLEADASRQASLMKSISVLKLRAGSRESRAAHYAEAISKGSVTTKEGATIFGTDAMIWAADEGLDSLENLLRSHAAELDAIGVPSSVQLARLEMRLLAATKN